MNVIVVGAGIAGLSTAWSLVKAGHSVSIVEQGPIPNPLAASGDHHRIIRRAYRAGTGYGQLISEAYEAWNELWTDLGESHLDPRGFLCISCEPGDKAEEYREGMEEGNYPYDLFEPEAAVERWPFLEPGGFRYVFFSPDGGALHCRKIASGLAAWLLANRANVYEKSKVVQVDAEAGRITLAGGETMQADRIVVTAGAWVLKLFPELGGELRTYRTALAYVDPPADLKAAWEVAPMILTGGTTDGYMIPLTRGAGMKFGSGLHKVPTSDADWNRQPVPGEGEVIRNLFSPPIARITEYKVTEVVTCAYTFTEDEKFLAYEKGKCLVVSACSGHGYKFGASVGRRVAKAVRDGDVAGLKRWLRAETA
ncbi:MULTISPECIES: FAD-dependent oxidoreductase [unclassified Mesorhizobium]|uniref:NAD(P)/FAD-dependent oxidoreductase n=1 Tax=unclassified Mesorhizobium TaxID=325217 RepID=UPI000BAF427A|nr:MULTISPECIES: FAD-dependent oxidoreductase [unclassified Mesorhizobium]TGT60113.1 FAD-dependent oxidoreductase [Mesorhizobium sp. M00.F.Ca.ET.170.01.1.1]AZO08273.1 FAD-dependent oxidoreductase [Mesorhizobium sp. M3A.F.Ca.ET.080.04.2.1]PBB85631.1 sarcosine oxidase [Mesorhizobium sp. WSM3876]RWB72307.1 MAG: FAD-dependent oxidoreductase [Mesorhizobium sp.]RWB89292.1 MAG: FAD-dependent oxidoreductase [Mesorhizobium sp.]